jgi:hypothetical protein
MKLNHRVRHLLRQRKHYKRHWVRVLNWQVTAYLVVLALWVIPIPNPIKLLAVSLHEMSHSLAALLTGGRIFGFAISPSGAGVTMGVGGNMFLILIAGYIGNSLWGAALHAGAARLQPKHALFMLLVIMASSTAFGWLTRNTLIFAVGSTVMVLALFPMADWIQRFFVQVVGSACCLYAPLEILGEVVAMAAPPSVFGVRTESDIQQLATLLSVHPFLVGFTVLAVQVVQLILVVRWTCSLGARQRVREDTAAAKVRRAFFRELHPERTVYKAR